MESHSNRDYVVEKGFEITVDVRFKKISHVYREAEKLLLIIKRVSGHS